jgi:hypothetical protein
MKELITNHYVQIMAVVIIGACYAIYSVIKLVKSCDNDKEDIQEDL